MFRLTRRRKLRLAKQQDIHFISSSPISKGHIAKIEEAWNLFFPFNRVLISKSDTNIESDALAIYIHPKKTVHRYKSLVLGTKANLCKQGVFLKLDSQDPEAWANRVLAWVYSKPYRLPIHQGFILSNPPLILPDSSPLALTTLSFSFKKTTYILSLTPLFVDQSNLSRFELLFVKALRYVSSLFFSSATYYFSSSSELEFQLELSAAAS